MWTPECWRSIFENMTVKRHVQKFQSVPLFLSPVKCRVRSEASTWGLVRLIAHLRGDKRWISSSGAMVIVRAKISNRKEILPHCHLVPTNPTLTDLGLNSGLWDEKLPTKRRNCLYFECTISMYRVRVNKRHALQRYRGREGIAPQNRRQEFACLLWLRSLCPDDREPGTRWIVV